jgi:RNA polymerase sigma-70 factor (ECF subfamily)
VFELDLGSGTPTVLDLEEDPAGRADLGRPPVDDEVLMTRIRAGDARAFATFYERHAAITFAVAMRTLHNPVLAAEVAQDGFMAVWRQRAQFVTERGSPRGWLLAIVQYRAIDVLRRESRRRGHETAGDEALHRAADDSVEQQTIVRDEARVIRALLDEIPHKQRQVIELAYVDGLSQTEIASRLKLPLGTVKGQTRLALDKRREAYPHPRADEN